ncbi:MAG: ATP-dependent sacrificial sulfur transferase LarE [Proteobacteria bacterium]|nr:ATP-dependent sacrificial sulfur transferase LarE [Pseudomonadota bacterium]
MAVLKRASHGAVAFSGGVDSTLLLKAAVEAYGGDCLAFYVRSPLQKHRVLEKVRQTCHELDCALQIVDLDPLSWPEFTANSDLRCYHCKKKIYSYLTSLLSSEYKLLDGTNLDDLGQDRPGLRAVRELGVQTPLVEAGLTKGDIRSLCREFQLACWNLPSESCLATRIAGGVAITPELLRDVAFAENFLETIGFFGCRVRLDGKSVFISLSQGDSEKLLESCLRDEVVKFFAKLNYTKVFLELSERPSILK